jgi:hypothetical protein
MKVYWECRNRAPCIFKLLSPNRGNHDQAGEKASVPIGREAMLSLKQQMPVPFQEEKLGLCCPGILKYQILNSATDAGNRL